MKNRTLSRSGLRPIERAWFSSKKTTIRSFHLSSRIASETPPMMTSCSVSAGVMARMLPSTMVWMFTEVGRQRDHEQAEPEEGGEDQADDGVLAQLGALVEEQHRRRREPAGEEGAEREGQAEHVGAGDAGHDRVRERVADQRPALQHQIGRQEGADAADQRRDPHGVDHVAVGEGLERGRLITSSLSSTAAGAARAWSS